MEPSFGKNLTIPYAAMDDITMAMQVVDIAMIKLLLIFPANPRS